MPEPRPRRKKSPDTTIFDVAKKAGVSIATVSLSLRNSPRIKLKTRLEVAKAAALLRYRPNLSAQGLASRQTNLIAICGWFFQQSLEQSAHAATEMLHGILGRLKGTRFAVYIVNWSTHLKERYALQVDFSNQRFICGSIWLSPHLTPKDRKAALKLPLPLVLADGSLPGIDAVTVDNILGGYLGTKHLLEAWPRRSLILVTGDPADQAPRDRLAGAKKAAREAGLDWPGVSILRADRYGFLDGMRIANTLANRLGKGRPSLSVFCLAGDWCAMGILSGLRQASIRVPEQVALMGYDGKIEAALGSPSLSTVEQPLFDLGFAAADALLRRIESPGLAPTQLQLLPQLRKRESA